MTEIYVMFMDNSTQYFANSSFTDVISFGVNRTLEEYNDNEARLRLAPMIYLGLLMMIGIPGNILVLIVYPSRFPKTTHRLFITGLAMADVLVCVVTLPFEIIEMKFIYTFYNEWACKFFRTCNTLFALTSIFILMGLSGDRYRRVCSPLRLQRTQRYTQAFLVCSVVLALLFSWPVFLISGTRLVSMGPYNITGHDCSLSDQFAKTRYPLIYNGVLFLAFIICMIALIVIYLLIGCKILKHSKYKRKFSLDSSSKSTSTTDVNSHEGENIKLQNDTHEDGFEDKNKRSKKKLLAIKSSRKHSKPNLSNSSKQDRIPGKVTKIAFAISLAFVLSYLPHLTISLLTALKGKFLLPPGPVVSAVLPIVTRSFAINNVVNPIIYWFMDKRFRDSCKLIFKNKFCCR